MDLDTQLNSNFRKYGVLPVGYKCFEGYAPSAHTACYLFSGGLPLSVAPN